MQAIKKIGKKLLVSLLAGQVRRLRRRHAFTVVAVVGSVGKTSSKIAIARLLGETRRVRWQEGNYNDPLTVPLVIFGHDEPNIFNIFAWSKILAKNERIIRGRFPYDVVVIELGTDAPGTIKQFGYIRPELAVVTAVDIEHTEFFGTIDAVAKEELAVFDFAKKVLVNTDDTASKYLAGRSYQSYGLGKSATYRAVRGKESGFVNQEVEFHVAGDYAIRATVRILGDQGAKIVLAAVAAAHELGLSKAEIEKGLKAVRPFAGRMQLLDGIKHSVLIDDTYNASPASVKAALDVLYRGDVPQRIAILGSMNELGVHSKQAHEEVGAYCDPKKLDAVVTIGTDAQEFLAPVARERGCKVASFASPYEAGAYVRSILRERAAVLAKGSQNRVFAEEALKTLLASKSDASKLVRQSPHWLRVKRRQFKP